MTITSSSLQNSVLGNHISANQFMSGYSDADKTSFSCLRMPSQIPVVYPLYFGHLQPKDSKSNFNIPSKLSSRSMITSEICAKQNPYGKTMALKKPVEADIKDTIGNSYEIGCDLSLRLGCLGSPHEIIDVRVDKDLGNFGSSTPQGNKLIDSPIHINKSSLKKSYICESVDTCSTKRKRKAIMDHPCVDEHFSWHPKLPFHDCTGRARNTGL